MSGGIAELWGDRGFTRATCFASGAAGPPVPIDPAPGESDYYLVRAASDCGAGTWGASFGTPDARAPLNASPGTPCP